MTHPLNPSPTERDLRNARIRQAVAKCQQAAWDECLRLAEEVLGPGWKPWMKIVLVDADHRRTGDDTPVAVSYKVLKSEGNAREVRYLGQGPDGVVVAERFEDVFGSLLTELHPTKTIEVKGRQVSIPRYLVYWSALERYTPRSPGQLAGARATRERKKAEKWAAEHPLYAMIEQADGEEGRGR